MNEKQMEVPGSACGAQNEPEEKLYAAMISGQFVIVNQEGEVVQWRKQIPDSNGQVVNSEDSVDRIIEQVFRVPGSEKLQADPALCDVNGKSTSKLTFVDSIEQTSHQESLTINYIDSKDPSFAPVTKTYLAHLSPEHSQPQKIEQVVSNIEIEKIIKLKTIDTPLGTIIKNQMTSLGPPVDSQPSTQVSKGECEIKLLSYQGLTITHSDILCLADEQFLNDSILEFGLLYIEHEILSPEDRSRTHMFSTFFYDRLITEPSKQSTIEVGPALPDSEKKHNRVKRWTKNVDIFEKDFLILPINDHFHWFLAIICYPGLLGVHDMITGEPIPTYKKRRKQVVKTKRCRIKRPCILILDSLVGKSRTGVCDTLREYLKVEYMTRKGEDREFTTRSMPGEGVLVPKQQNQFDCGIYTMHYVQSFFQFPLFSFEMPINGGNIVFHENFNTHQREEIYKVIKALINNTNPDLLHFVPDLEFNPSTE